ncbi:MAG: hypothetical protein R3F02_06945 [Thiolinea sp.]
MNKLALGKIHNGIKLLAHAFQFDRQFWQLGVDLLERGLSELWDKSA